MTDDQRKRIKNVLPQEHSKYGKRGRLPKWKATNKAVGISRGGRNVKIHTLVDGSGNPIAFMLSLGNDSTRAVPILKQIDIIGYNIPDDKTYGAQATNPSILKTFRCQSF